MGQNPYLIFNILNSKIWLSSPHIGESELENVIDAFKTNWIAPLGPYVDLFEKRIADNVGVKAVAVLNSGTSAIHMALKALGISNGDYVLCQSFTFVATANPILYQGANPIFVDSEEDTWNMCPLALEKAIKSSISEGIYPRAIIPVHLYGMPAKMDQIVAISKEYNIPIVEDAAEAFGSSYFNKPCGSLGDFGVISFNGNKIITTSSGGAVLSNDIASIDHIRHLSTQARDDAPHYQHSNLGYNYRMSNVLAGIGVGQLEVLEKRVLARRSNFSLYKNELNDIDGISFLKEPMNFYSNRWLTTILIDPIKTNGKTREDLRLYLASQNIESRPLWKPLHMQPLFKEFKFFGEGISEKLFENGLCLPSGSNLSNEDLARVVKSIRYILAN
jgi:dTDP-4-amino-4,6-dideoxygalactose transaminase